ncbi:hypothetical protein BX666DRAFT_1912297 [Dichotomocladium elegans]|nr:hypothetical protein BX666DRAFT_1912297 [Dichotomocladium elegans]
MFITKGQAACLVLGDAVTEANRAKCKTIVERTPFEVVYTLERGNTRPIAIGKAVAQRDPFSYWDTLTHRLLKMTFQMTSKLKTSINLLKAMTVQYLRLKVGPAHANQRTIIMTSKQQKQASWTFCTAF